MYFDHCSVAPHPDASDHDTTTNKNCIINSKGGTMAETDGTEEDALIEECGICGGDIIIDSYCEEEDIVYCNDCEAEYLIRTVDPIRLKLLDDDIDTDVDDSDDTYDEEYD